MSLPIPQPPGYPLVGNIADVDPQNSVGSLMHLAEKYGEFSLLVACEHICHECAAGSRPGGQEETTNSSKETLNDSRI